MKTLRLNNKKIIRVNDSDAFKMVQAGKATYIPKNVWKREVRDAKDA